MTFKSFIVFCSALLCSSSIHAQASQQKTKPSIYLGASAGVGYTFFNDFTTTALNHEGVPALFSLAFIRNGSRVQSEFKVENSTLDTRAFFNGHEYRGEMQRISTSLTTLFKATQRGKVNLHWGAILDFTAIARQNESLLNNSDDISLFPALFGAFKIHYNMDRVDARVRRLGKLNFHQKARRRGISYQLNLGLINSHYTSSFIHLDDYNFNFFSGIRSSSRLAYTHFLENKSAVSFNYVWDLIQTGGETNTFQTASHTFQIRFFLNLNNH